MLHHLTVFNECIVQIPTTTHALTQEPSDAGGDPLLPGVERIDSGLMYELQRTGSRYHQWWHFIVMIFGGYSLF